MIEATEIKLNVTCSICGQPMREFKAHSPRCANDPRPHRHFVCDSPHWSVPVALYLSVGGPEAA